MSAKKFLLVIQLLAVGLLAFSLVRWYQVAKLISSSVPGKFQVIETYCAERRSSKVLIRYPEGEYYLEYPLKNCRDLAPGDSLELYYSKELNLFSVPGRVTYDRYVYGLVAFLIWSLIPWMKIWRYVTK